MFKRKKKETKTFLDNRIITINNDRLEAYRRLTERTEDVIVAQGVVDLYPDGADKEKAIKDLASKKIKLLCAIGVYDSLRNEFYRALEEPFERIYTINFNTHTKTSHEIIEEAYKNFYKRK